ncbi:MAG: fatty acid desaturase [Rhodospirillales bacterium]
MEKAFGADSLIQRSELKQFARRNDISGLANLGFHFSALIASGGLIYLAQGTLWIIPAMFVHGAIIAFLFAPMHETSHGTAFRTRWLNELVFRIVSLIYISPPMFFRYFHAAHHTYTQIPGKDPDVVMLSPGSWTRYFSYISSLPFWKRNITWFISHALGRVSDRDSWFIPEDELPRIYREARVMLTIYATLAVISVAMSSTVLLFYWLIPRIMGEPIMRWVRVTEHCGCEETADLRKNTRTTRAAGWFHLFFWNMSYHAEHHLCPAVPFHALPDLHDRVGDVLHPVGRGYLAVHGLVLRNIRKGIVAPARASFDQI